MRRVLVVPALLGGLLAALWWNVGAERGEHDGVALVPDDPAHAELQGHALAPVDRREPLSEIPSAVSQTALPKSEGLQVEVVDALDAPVAEADVYVLWIDEAREREFEKQGFEFEDLPEAVEEEGEQGRTDERGSSWFSLGSGELVAVVARHGASFGMDFLDELEPSGSQPLHVRIQVLADFDVTVRVLDHLGNPAEDVPLELRSDSVQLEDSTGSDGEVEFEHVGLLCHDEPMAEWVVSAAVLTRETVRRELGRLTREATVVLQLPPMGSVEVLVEDADGEPIEDGSRVSLSTDAFETLESARTANGVARFSHVEVGLELEARAHRGNAGHQVRSPAFSGPLRPGDAVRHSIAFGMTSSVLPLRLLPPRGRSMKGSLGVQILGDTGRVTRTDLDPLEDGSYRLDLAQQAEETRLRVQLDAWTGQYMGARFVLLLPVPFGILPEREVMLEDAPILLAGRIVDPSGRPVLTFTREDGSTDSPRLQYEVPGLSISTSLLTDEQGRFEIRSFFSAVEIPVRVWRRKQGGEVTRVPAGSSDLVLVLDERE